MEASLREWLFILAVAAPLATCPLLAIAGGALGRRVGWAALAFPLLSLICLLALAWDSGLPGSGTVLQWPWIPSLGVNLAFLLDGLSLFFGLIVSGMGVLVVFYAIFYLDPEMPHQGRFYCYLVLFMAAMLGTVFADNLLLLFIYWELTGIASFMLIGFLHHEEDSRVGARQALLITGFTGLVLLVGVIMIGQAAGTYSLAELLTSKLPFEQHKTWLNAALIMMMVGAFGKSAQFPLHFWLPNAMAAPTPVSAYLHSATMVKLGVFLSARLYPLAAETEWWAPLLGTIGFTTAWLAALLAVLSHELKAILAYSTVSQLGFLIGYYGLGPVEGVEYDYLHILNHVLYKGCLFMVAGVIMHATGRKDIRHIGGLWRRLPVLAIVAAIATASMAGVIGTTGFLSKEAMFVEIFAVMNKPGVLGTYAAIGVIVMSLFKVAFSVRLFVNIFLGKEPEAVRAHFHAPHFAMQVPALLLALATLVFGVAPALLDRPFAWFAVPGLNRAPEHLALWHGFTAAFWSSVVVVVLGLGLYYLGQITGWRWHIIPRLLRFDHFFEGSLDRFSRFTKKLTGWLRADQPLDYLPIIIGFTLLVVGGALWRYAEPVDVFRNLSLRDIDPLRAFAAGLIALSVIGAVLLQRWTTQLIALSVAGFLVCFYFVLYRAPDLALTQILIEVVTLFMILLLLGRFPHSAERGEALKQHSRGRNLLNLALALGVGGTMTTVLLLVMANPHTLRLGNYFLEQTVPLAEGSNAVNTILVDFRGFDTLGEITVLVIAMLGVLGLLMRYKRSPEEYKAGPMGPPGFGTDDKEQP